MGQATVEDGARNELYGLYRHLICVHRRHLGRSHAINEETKQKCHDKSSGHVQRGVKHRHR